MNSIVVIILHAFVVQAHGLPHASLLPTASRWATRTAHAMQPPRASKGDKPLGIRPKIENVGKMEDLAKEGKASSSIGFRYDAAVNKWIRDDKSGDTMANWADKGGAVNKSPLSGGSYMVWPAVYVSLMDRGMMGKQVTGEEALKMVREQGAVLVDVELESAFKADTMEGAVSVPIFRRVAGNSMFDQIKKVAMGSLLMTPTERNPDFAAMAKERLPLDKPVIVACRRGGSLETIVKAQKYDGEKEYEDPDKAFGIESRSLKACYELFEAGFEKVYFLRGGMNQYSYDGHPFAPGKLAQTSTHVISIPAAVLIGFFLGSGIIFIVFRFRREAWTASTAPLLAA